jgi:hypothetical protein
MNRLFWTIAAVAVSTGLGIAGASAANIAPAAPGVAVYGAVPATPPAGGTPPTDAPAGYQYHWVYSYDHHGYHGHWEAQRIGM